VKLGKVPTTSTQISAHQTIKILSLGKTPQHYGIEGFKGPSIESPLHFFSITFISLGLAGSRNGQN